MRLEPHFAPPFAPAQRADDPRVRTLPLLGYRQVRDYTCGYACALVVGRYLLGAVDGRALYRDLGTDRSGTRQTALVRALRERGVAVRLRYDLDFDRLRALIDAGKPIIGYRNAIDHWVVLYGYGLAPARVFIADARVGVPCEHAWDAVEADLGGFAMICSARVARREPDASAAQVAQAAQESPSEPADAARDELAAARDAPQLVVDFDAGIVYG